LGGGYDVALIFGVLVSETDEGKLALLRKTHAALSPGGLVVIREFLLDPDDPARSPVFLPTGPKDAIFGWTRTVTKRFSNDPTPLQSTRTGP
jgi:hypothetical protein